VEEGAFDLTHCERCPRAYESVFQACLTMAQSIVAGDNWGYYVVPFIEKHPVLTPLFVVVWVSVILIIMNLILALVVDASHEARKGDEHELAVQAMRARELAMGHLLTLCTEMDEDRSGNLTIDEIIAGYDSNQRFRDTLGSMQIEG